MKTNFKVPKKTIIALTMTAILAVTLTYALLMHSAEISHTLTIKGVKVSVWVWIDDVTSPTTEKISHDWNKVASEQVSSTENLVISNEGSESLTLSFSDTLNATIGTIGFEIEVYKSGEGWVFGPWGTGETVPGTNKFYEGCPDNPLGAGEYVGMRPTSPSNGDLGHIRITIAIAVDPPMGVVDPFTTTVTGTEYIA